MEKIINELVDKRFADELSMGVVEVLENDHRFKLHGKIREIMDEVLSEKEDLIREVIRKSIDSMIINSSALTTFGTNIKFNASRYDVQKILDEIDNGANK